MNKSGLFGVALLPTTSVPRVLAGSECAYFRYDNVAMIVWFVASVLCFLALVSTIHTIYRSYQLWSTVQDLENSIIDLIDESCQILIPLGVCKQICHPHHIGTVNANYLPNGQKQEQKPGRKENRYPEDVTFPPSDIENVYDVMGDEDTRKSKTITLPSVKDSDDVEEKKELLNHQQLSRELQKTPVMESRESVDTREQNSDKKKVAVKVAGPARTPTREPQPSTNKNHDTTPKKSGRKKDVEPKKPAVATTPKKSPEVANAPNLSKEGVKKSQEKSALPISNE